MELIDHNMAVGLHTAEGSVYFEGYTVEGFRALIYEGNAELDAGVITLADEDSEPIAGPLNRWERRDIIEAVEGLINEEWADAAFAGWFEDYDEHDWNDRRGYWP